MNPSYTQPTGTRLYRDLWRFAIKYAEHRYTDRTKLPTGGHFSADCLYDYIKQINEYHVDTRSYQPDLPTPRTLDRCLRRNLANLRTSLDQLDKTLDTPRISLGQTIRDIYGDLVALHDENSTFKLNLHRGYVSITTAPISLRCPNSGCAEDLGRFEIKLFINGELPGAHALDPNPAQQSDGDTTHPHVSSNSICWGEGDAAAHQALKDGRLCDLFDIATSILLTYNPDNPFVTLEEWRGYQCGDCGEHCDSEGECRECGHNACSDCLYQCEHCDRTVCPDCSNHCSDCGDCVCNRHANRCADCNNHFCPNCHDGDDRCVRCQEKYEKDQAEEEKERQRQIEEEEAEAEAERQAEQDAQDDEHELLPRRERNNSSHPLFDSRRRDSLGRFTS